MKIKEIILEENDGKPSLLPPFPQNSEKQKYYADLGKQVTDFDRYLPPNMSTANQVWFGMAVEAFNKIKTDCSESVSVIVKNKTPLWRGFNSKQETIVGASRQDRRPKDMTGVDQEIIDAFLEIAGFTALRQNSIFATSRHSMASSYGTSYYLFPKNGAQYTCNLKYEDLYNDVFNDLADYKPTAEEFILGKIQPDTISKDQILSLQKLIEGLRNQNLSKYGFLYEILNTLDSLADESEVKVKDLFNQLNIKYWKMALDKLQSLEGDKSNTQMIKVYIERIIKNMKFFMDKYELAAQGNKTAEEIFAMYEQNPAKAEKVASELGFIKNDFEKSLLSGNEIYINGGYYAVKDYNDDEDSPAHEFLLRLIKYKL